ncbi:putative glutamate synthase subunit beta [Luteitalea pratensis]|uniref:Putative glutamate synthase subunit beta n=1 Tax=Luteitalea pratensis TaxID=1855912 RepID=A0A143PQB0_LUTPR|nr:NAD(P)-binding domain-containing protein [Luteitalea pratensis]AMY10802.1 putative glutamate synthase subunit beta [Luteitalea pratensis]
MELTSLPIAIIGAGPVGLAAAAQVLSRGLTPLVFEAGPSAGAAMRRWGHVRMFSPWKYDVDAEGAAILERHGWVRPDGETFPTGRELVEQYLEPLASTRELAPHIRYDSRVTSVARHEHDLMKDATRETAPFLVRVDGAAGEQDVLAQAVIDASGTTERPGVLGGSGLPAIGERSAAGRIAYGIPDVLGSQRSRYQGRRVLVVGSGHSALNALLDLAQLVETDGRTHIIWAIRRPALAQTLGGARNDQLAERGRLGARVRTLLDTNRLQLVRAFRIARITSTVAGLVVSDGAQDLPPVDEIIAATGFRPDWSILGEVRLDLDPAVESPRALAPLIDPNVHSCGTVRPHGAEELKHPDANLFAIGMKSYGRAPTFLLLTGYEQARSVVSAIAGDWDAARRVELVLPETGACSLDRDEAPTVACCGSAPAPLEVLTATPVAVRVGAGCCG